MKSNPSSENILFDFQAKTKQDFIQFAPVNQAFDLFNEPKNIFAFECIEKNFLAKLSQRIQTQHEFKPTAELRVNNHKAHVGIKRIFEEVGTVSSDLISPVPHKIRKDNQSIMFAPKISIKCPVRFNQKLIKNFFETNDQFDNANSKQVVRQQAEETFKPFVLQNQNLQNQFESKRARRSETPRPTKKLDVKKPQSTKEPQFLRSKSFSTKKSLFFNVMTTQILLRKE